MPRRLLRRALRHAFTILSALSLLLCVAVCVLWANSVVSSDPVPSFAGSLWANRSLWQIGVERGRGVRAVIVWDTVVSGARRWGGERYGGGNGSFASRGEVLGFRLHYLASTYHDGDMVADPFVSLTLPYWFVVLVTSVMPLRAVGGWWKRRQRVTDRSRGVCPSCDYDLRAHSGGERCPECGTPVQSVA